MTTLKPPKIPPNPRKPLEAQHLAWKRRYYSGGKFSLIALYLSDTKLLAQRKAMQSDVEEMNEIIDNFLALIRSGREEAFFSGALLPLLQRITELGIHRYSLKIDWLSPNTYDPTIRYKPLALERVFRNLLDNVARYGGGHVQLSVAKQNNFVIISIKDFGPGLSANQLASWPDFEQVRHSNHQGAGLGLKICHRIMEIQGGTFDLHNIEPSGLEVRVGLPTVSAEIIT